MNKGGLQFMGSQRIRPNGPTNTLHFHGIIKHLQIAEERRKTKGKGERERYTQLNAEFQRIVRRDKKVFFNGK